VIIISTSPYSPFLALVVILLNSALAYLILSGSGWVGRFLGPNGTNALSRITALLIAALAVSFVVTGITNIIAAIG